MKKFLPLLITVLIIGATFVAAFSSVSAAGDLKITTKDGVMYVGTENSVVESSPSTTTRSESMAVNPPRGFAQDIGTYFNSVLSAVMLIAGLLVFYMLITAGIEWITSGGEKSKTDSARNKIVAAIIGIVILAASYAILLLVLNFLGFRDLNDLFRSLGSVNDRREATSSTRIQILSESPVPSPSSTLR